MLCVEICIQTGDSQRTADSVAAARVGGAQRVELCSSMIHHGLSPASSDITAARRAFGDSPGVVAMIRPRAGHFCYSASELRQMVDDIQRAADAGADGVALGVLAQSDGSIDRRALERLLRTARSRGLRTTFHRAFDAATKAADALDVLITAGVDRVLTSGGAWGAAAGALEGQAQLQQLLIRANGRIEIVIGGGVNSTTLPPLLQRLWLFRDAFSIHAYSGATEKGVTTAGAVRRLVEADHVSLALANIAGKASPYK